MSDVFISYARKDEQFVRALADELIRHGKDVWVDWEDIPATADWWNKVRAGIEESPLFLFVLSPPSLRSKVCRNEIDHASGLNKRIVPILLNEVDQREVPPAIGAPNWVDFRQNGELAALVDRLVQAMDLDLDHLEAHTRWLVRGLEWERSGHDTSLLLRGSELRAADGWLARAGAGEKQPAATPVHFEFIHAAGRAATRRQRSVIAAVSVALLVAIGLAVVAFLERGRAIEQRQVAVSRLLASQALTNMNRQLDVGLRFSVEAFDVAETPEARNSIFVALRRSERVVGFFPPQPGRVFGIDISPDAPLLATGGDGGVLRLWSIPDRRLVAELEGHQATVREVRFSDDGTLLASRDESGTLIVSDVRLRRVIAHPLAGEPVTALAFARGENVLAVGTSRGMLAFWSRAQGRIAEHRLADAPLATLAFDHAGRRLAVGGPRGLFLLPYTGAGTAAAPARLGGPNIVDLAFAPSGNRLATVEADRVAVWSLSARPPSARPLTVPSGRPVSIGVSSAGTLATGSDDGTVAVWDVAWKSPVERLTGHGDAIRDLAFARRGAVLATAGQDRKLILWDLGRRPYRGRSSPGGAAGPVAPITDLVHLGDDGRSLAVSGFGRVVVTDEAGRSSRDLRNVPGARVHLAANPERGQLAAAGAGPILLWTTPGASGRPAVFPRPGAPPVTALALSRDGELLAAGLQTGAVRVWRIADRRVLRTLRTGAGRPVSTLAFSPAGSLLGAGSERGTVTVWDLASDGEGTPVQARGQPVRALSFSPDGKRLAFGGTDKRVTVWDLATRTVAAVATGHLDAVTDIAFAPDGEIIASSDEGGRVVLFAVRDRRESGEPLSDLPGAIDALDFRPDGHALAGGASTGSVVVWDDVLWRAEEAREAICALLGGDPPPRGCG
jgi:WD40 repeat protein